MAKRTTNTQPSTSSRSVLNPASSLSATKKAFSDPVAVAAIFAACAAVGTLTYGWGKDVGQAELKMRQELAAMDLPQIAEDTRASTADLKIASAAFKDMLVNNATYLEMLTKHDAQIRQISDLTSIVSNFTQRDKSQQEMIKTLEARLAEHENPEQVYQLEKGRSQQVGGGELIVGLQYNLGSFAEITINGARHSAQAGDIVEVKGMRGSNCRLKMVSVSLMDNASFSAECSK